MRRLIIHVGMYKTGSSAIQAALKSRLSDPAFRYVDLGRPNHSAPVCSLFSVAPETYYIHRLRGRTGAEITEFNASVRRRLTSQFESSRSGTSIISGEDIASLSEVELVRLRDFAARFFQEILVVAYVRPPVSFMESAFQQMVKTPEGDLTIEEGYPHYRAKFEKLDPVFGRAQVHLWKFDPKRFPQGNVVLDFYARLGIRMSSRRTRRVNVSLSKEALSLLYIYRKFGPGFVPGGRAVTDDFTMINALRPIGRTRLRFAPALTGPVLRANRDDIRWMESRLGDSLEERRRDSGGAVRSLEELMEIDPVSVRALKKLLGRKAGLEGVSGDTPQEVALLMAALKTRAVGSWSLRLRHLLATRLRRYGRWSPLVE